MFPWACFIESFIDEDCLSCFVAAAAAAKKAASANISGNSKSPVKKEFKRDDRQHGDAGNRHIHSDSAQTNGHVASKATPDHGKASLASSSTRLSVPFRHVHFGKFSFSLFLAFTFELVIIICFS